jgi:hypothetical protein
MRACVGVSIVAYSSTCLSLLLPHFMLGDIDTSILGPFCFWEIPPLPPLFCIAIHLKDAARYVWGAGSQKAGTEPLLEEGAHLPKLNY